MKHLFFLLFSVTLILACTQSLHNEHGIGISKVKLGETQVSIVNNFASVHSNVLFINVHADETTSIEALKLHCTTNAVNYCYLQHDTTRRIFYTLSNEQFTIDPNRIFTNVGRTKTLKDGGNFSKKANRALKLFAEHILDFIQNKKTIVALHNNTNDNYSILSYLPEGDESANTKFIYVNPEMDPDDFIYTTDLGIYKTMKKSKVNVILQNNNTCIDDGSLSVYCGKHNIRYVNIEAEEGHLNEQLDMINRVSINLKD